MAPTTTKPKAEKKGTHRLVEKIKQLTGLITTRLGAVNILREFGMIPYDPSTTRFGP